MEINPALSTAYSEETQAKSPTQQLDKDAFLKILVNQLRYQNPLNPQDANSFVDQIVQLTSVEQMTKLSTNMQKMLDSQEFNKAVNLIGHEVTVLEQNKELTVGIVEKVTMVGGKPHLVVQNAEYGLDNLVSITKPEPEVPKETEEDQSTVEQPSEGAEEDGTPEDGE